MYVKTFLRFPIEPVIILWFLRDCGQLFSPTEHYALVSKIPVRVSESLYVLLYLFVLVDGVVEHVTNGCVTRDRAVAILALSERRVKNFF